MLKDSRIWGEVPPGFKRIYQADKPRLFERIGMVAYFVI